MFVTALLAATLAAPVPKVKAPELYFPTVEGTRYVMQRKSGGETVETTHTVTKVVEKDGTYTVTVSRDVSGQVVEFKYEVSANGVFALPRGDEKGEPRAVFKRPAKGGETWTTEQTGPGQGGTRTTTYTVGKEEEVTVPAGKFKAVVVAAETTLGGRVFKSTSWYVAGVGIVKTVAQSDGIEQVQEMKEFTPGKAK